MLTTAQRNSLRRAIAIAPLALAVFTSGCHAQQPAAAPAASATPAPQLQPYTAPDQSASAGVPAGWKVTQAAQTAIQMAGPNGETVFLGTTVIAKNAAFQLGTSPANGIDISMPYSATLGQKLTMIVQQNAAKGGKPAPQITIDSTTALQLPAAVGQCARIVADASGAQGAQKLMTVFCSLPVDSGGVYKNILLLAQAPAATATASAPAAHAIFSSYRIPAAWLQKKLAPFTAPPASAASTAAAVAAINRSTMLGAAAVDNSANCFDLSVLRETPTYDLPRSCGGSKPD